MNQFINSLVDKHFSKLMVTFRQLEEFYHNHLTGNKIVIFGAGQNTIDAAQGMLPLFSYPDVIENAEIIGIEPNKYFFEKAQTLVSGLKCNSNVNIKVLHANPLGTPLDNVDTIILPRTLHELLLLQMNPSALDDLVAVCDRAQNSGGKVLLADPNYRPEIYTSDWPQQEIQSAIEDIASVYGHFHPPEELLSPEVLVNAFEKGGYKLINTIWKKNESTKINKLVGAHFTVFEKLSFH